MNASQRELSDGADGRVLRVRRSDDKADTVQEYTVATRLFSPAYSKVFREEDNEGLVATDTQKNTVYVVAKRSSATTPEGFGIDLCRHLLNEYPVLTAVEAEITEDLWRRTEIRGVPHEHCIEKAELVALLRPASVAR